MDIDEYQREARLTDQISLSPENDDGVVVPLLGISGEIGSLQAAYKKNIRDGDQYREFSTDVAEELGDIRQTLSVVASQLNIDAFG